MADKEVATVDYLLDIFQKASKAGYGDMKIKCADGFLHTDEISGCYSSKSRYFELEGRLWNLSAYERMSNFCRAVERAQNKFLKDN